MGRMLLTEPAVLAELQLVRRIFLVLCRCIIALLALGTSEGNDVAHIDISLTLPERGGLDFMVTQ